MFKHYVRLLLILSILFFISCEEPTEPDTTPPTVTITFPQDGSTVYEITSITCISTDNDGVEKVELWIDGVYADVKDETEPYILNWNTTTYEDGTSHTISVRSYDFSGNKADSDLITLHINQLYAYPDPVNLYPIYYDNGIFNIRWTQSTADDFQSYILYEWIIDEWYFIFTTNDINETEYSVTGIGLNEMRYYSVAVVDIYDFITYSDYLSASSYPKIIYESAEVKGDCQIFIMEFDGSNQTQLTDFTDMSDLLNQNRHIQFSQDGLYIYYLTVEIGGTAVTNLSRMDLDGNNKTQVTTDSDLHIEDYHISNDGTMIVFESFNSITWESNIYTMNIDGSNVTQLTTNPNDDRQPEFSPDGLKIVYTTRRENSKGINIMDVNGNNKIELTANDLWHGNSDPKFSPGGEKILFGSSRGNNDGDVHLWIMDIDGSEQTKLTTSSYSEIDPVYSFDGSLIAYDRRSDIAIMNSDGSNQIRLTTDGINYRDRLPQFSYDGSYILFESNRFNNNFEILMISSDGSNMYTLTNGHVDNIRSVRPKFQPQP